jgi:hypothetical protein
MKSSDEQAFLKAARGKGYLVNILRGCEWPRFMVMVPGGDVVFLEFSDNDYPSMLHLGRAVFHPTSVQQAMKILERQ